MEIIVFLIWLLEAPTHLRFLKFGYAITPQTLTNLAASQTLNFTAATRVISGFVMDNSADRVSDS